MIDDSSIGNWRGMLSFLLASCKKEYLFFLLDLLLLTSFMKKKVIVFFSIQGKFFSYKHFVYSKFIVHNIKQKGCFYGCKRDSYRLQTLLGQQDLNHFWDHHFWEKSDKRSANINLWGTLQFTSSKLVFNMVSIPIYCFLFNW